MKEIPKDETIKSIIESGGLIIYPTETAYGLGAGINHEYAIEKIYDTKKRDKAKKLIAIVPSIEVAKRYCFMNKDEIKLCNKFMPGPLSIICRKKEFFPTEFNKEFVFRISSNPIAHRLATIINAPLIATSANMSGKGNAYSIKDIGSEIIDRVDLVIDNGTLKKNPSSTIVRIYNGDIEIVRPGKITKEEIISALKED
ncbi:MAG: threonylcarbamoyl-AMP synthase [Candidatus Aenigmarchaeota archaeon]|nr:threonylcarbamoyl-AMP synthase [Candidatus Aenigmarchaeota archaeon]